jgi:cathepsin L
MVAVTSNSYSDVMTAISSKGPLTITVDAGGWHDYEEGVFSGGNHSHPDLDHLVQLVGYGTDPKLGDYFLVRNSWTCES